jgi:hypothetical protein
LINIPFSIFFFKHPVAGEHGCQPPGLVGPKIVINEQEHNWTSSKFYPAWIRLETVIQLLDTHVLKKG